MEEAVKDKILKLLGWTSGVAIFGFLLGVLIVYGLIAVGITLILVSGFLLLGCVIAFAAIFGSNEDKEDDE